MELTSESFAEGGSLPRRHTCDADDVSPPLAWTDVSPATGAFALVVDDPDAPGGTWVHWVVCDLPADLRSLMEGAGNGAPGAPPMRHGRNDFGKLGYGGPCPPPGRPHRYFFRLYALRAPVDLHEGATVAELERAMEGRILATATLMGRYGRGQ